MTDVDVRTAFDGAAPSRWLPKRAQRLGKERMKKALIGILSRSGVGKSHLVHQLAMDPDFGPDEVLVLMAEDATATYDAPVAIARVRHLKDLEEVVSEIREAGRGGGRLPKVIVWDSMSGTLDYQRMYYDSNPILTEGKQRDKRAEFGDLGYTGMDQMIRLRDDVGVDVIVTATTYEGGGGLPEFAIEGRLLPKNFVRLTSVTLHLQSQLGRYDPQTQPIIPYPHRTIGMNEKGKPDGTYIDRFFYTMDNGEVQCKGHHALFMKEKAYLPDVLRKIHNWTPTTGATTQEEKK